MLVTAIFGGNVMNKGRSKTPTKWLLIAIFGLAVGYFLGEFLYFISLGVAWFSFLSYLAFAYSISFENIGLNLMFLSFSFDLVLSFSIMGCIVMMLFLFIYYRK